MHSLGSMHAHICTLGPLHTRALWGHCTHTRTHTAWGPCMQMCSLKSLHTQMCSSGSLQAHVQFQVIAHTQFGIIVSRCAVWGHCMHTHTVWGHCIQMCNLKSLHTHTQFGVTTHTDVQFGVTSCTRAQQGSLHTHMQSVSPCIHTCTVWGHCTHVPFLGVTAYTQMCTLGVTARPHAQQCCTIPELHVPSPTCCVCTPCSTVSACKQLPALQAASCTTCMAAVHTARQ